MRSSRADRYAQELQEWRRIRRYRWWLGVLVPLVFAISLIVGTFESPAWRVRKIVIYAPQREMARELRALEFDGPTSYVFCRTGSIIRKICDTSHRVASVAWVRRVPRDMSIRLLAVPRRPAVAIKPSAKAKSYFLVDETGCVYAAVREPPPGAGMARICVPSCSRSLAKMAKPEPAKCSLTTCILIGLRRSGLSVPYHSAESA